MRSPERSTTATFLAALTGVALVAAACGSDSNESSVTTASDDTETTASDDTETTAAMADDDSVTSEVMDEAASDAAVPERVVSLSPTHTEIMFAIGAGDLLVAVDQFSNYPEAALELPNELSGFEPDVEAIASYEPDLVLIGGDFTGLGEQLGALDIASWDGPAAASFDDTYAQIEQLGAATGHIGEAAELVSSMQTSIAELAEAAPQPDAPLTYFHELGPELFSSTSTTFIGEVYGLFGLENIADTLEAEAGQYPQVNAEFLVEASPDLVFLADTKCCPVTSQSFGERDGFENIAAVQNGNVIELDDDVASRWGPRIVDYIEVVATAVEQAAQTV